MSRRIKRKYRTIRQEFKKDLKVECESDSALPMLIVQTYRAKQHYRHITKIWSMFISSEFENFHRAYNELLFGEVLTGEDSIWRSLYFSNSKLYNKYHGLIPESFAMGDALGVVYSVIR